LHRQREVLSADLLACTLSQMHPDQAVGQAPARST
jgi:hypothetical protein